MSNPKKTGGINIFAAAAAKPTAAPEKASKSKTPEVVLGADLDELAALSSIIKALETKFKAKLEVVKAAGNAHFVEEGAKLGRRPQNFKGIAKQSTASVQLKEKGAASKINEDEMKILDANKIPYTKRTEPGVFYFNPELNGNSELLGKISKALNKIDELDGIEVIKFRPEETVHVVDEASIDALFATEDSEVIAKLLPMVSTTAVSPKLNPDVSIATTFAEVLRSFVTDSAAKPVEL